MNSIQCNGRLLSLRHPVLMGIINITPDSFFPGSRVKGEDVLIRTASQMLEEGASILDLGGMSTRPGAEILSETEEKARLIPAIELLAATFPGVILSVDSYRPAVAEAALLAGASLINDIGAETGPDMPRLAAAFKVPYICMHMRGTPESMQKLTSYDDVVTEVMDALAARAAFCRRCGVHDIIIDPGFGFAKNITQNFTLLKSLSAFRAMGFPLMVGLSRKSTVYRTLDTTPAEALNGSTVLHTIALGLGADILRVHDVAPAREAIRLLEALKKAGSPD